MHNVIAVLALLVAAQSVADTQVAHQKQAHQAFFCAAVFIEYGSSPHYTELLSEAGRDLLVKSERYATMYGMSESGIAHSKESGMMQAIDLKAQNKYMDPAIETECIMIYRAVDAITAGE